MSRLLPRQIIGILLAAAITIMTLSWLLSGQSLTLPTIEVETAPIPVAPAANAVPDAVRLAKLSLAGKQLPKRVHSNDGYHRLIRVGDQRAIVCATDESCALIAAGSPRFLIATGGDAEMILRRAARSGELR